MDYFIKNIKTKVNTAIDNIINSPSMIRKNLVVTPTEISPTDSEPISTARKLTNTVGSGYITDSSYSLSPTSQGGILSHPSDVGASLSPCSLKRSGDLSFEETTRSTPDENPTESDETEEKENSESDTSLLDASLNSAFHRFYHPGYRGNKNISRLVLEEKVPKLTRQISEPCTKYQSIVESSHLRKDKEEIQPEHTLLDDDMVEKPEPYYYPSPRRDSLFDTIQLKSSMNHHLKYGDVKTERISFTKGSKRSDGKSELKELRQSSVCESSTNILLRKQLTINESVDRVIYQGNDDKEEEIDKLGDIGISLIDEDGRRDSLEIDITDMEAVNEETDLKNARRQSITDRLNKRRNSDIMAEIIRLSAENRRKEFKGLLNDYTKIVRSIDSEHSSKNPLKRDLFTLDSVDASSEDSEVHMKYGLVSKEVNDSGNHSNNHHVHHGNRCYRQQFNLASQKQNIERKHFNIAAANKSHSNSEDSNNDKGSSNESTTNSKDDEEDYNCSVVKNRRFISNSALPD